MKIVQRVLSGHLKRNAIDTDAMRKTLEDGAKRRVSYDLYLAILAGNDAGKVFMLHRKRNPVESKHISFLKDWLSGFGWQFQHVTGESEGLWAGLFTKE